MFLIAEMLEGAVFLLNRIFDLLALTVCPDQELYLLRKSLIIMAWLEVAVVKMTRSSANKIWFKEEQDLAILKPHRLWWNILDITSTPIIKRKGDSGSPWRRSLDGENNPKGLPFSSTENEDVECRVWSSWSTLDEN
jgi:hypothetical protein